MVAPARFRILSRIPRRVTRAVGGGVAEWASGTCQSVVEALPYGIGLFDAGCRLLLANPRLHEIYGRRPGQLRTGTPMRQLIADSVAAGRYPGRTSEAVWAERRAFIGRRERGTFVQTLGDGQLIALLHEPMPDGGCLVTYDDVTERHRREERARFLAEHDPLTQLPNRRLFEERMLAALSAGGRPSPLALLFLDLDGFKAVNDRHGHAAGDGLLRRVADRLTAELREGDTAARLGGDEFALLLPGTSAVGAAAVARRIIAVLSEPMELVPGLSGAVGVSIGIACGPRDGQSLEALLPEADSALYEAKRAGRGTFRYAGKAADPRLNPPAAPGR